MHVEPMPDAAKGAIFATTESISLVEAEAIEAFNSRTGAHIPLTATRRNLVTRGVHRHDFRGNDFRIGSVTLRGVELREPSSKLARYLSATFLSTTQIVHGFVHRCGLRADVLTAGITSGGNEVVKLGQAQGDLW
ncbi:MAG: MOSC domain-containing protein [Steroidobacteraceae bacterium]